MSAVREALEFYSVRRNYERRGGAGENFQASPIQQDDGALARAALSALDAAGGAGELVNWHSLLVEARDRLNDAFGELTCGAMPNASETEKEKFELNFFAPARETLRRLNAALASSPAPVAGVVPEGFVLVPREPTEEMWGELARQIVMWRDMDGHTGAALYRHLKHSGREIPEWLYKEIPDVEHVPPKGSVAVAIYKAMLAAAPAAQGEGER